MTALVLAAHASPRWRAAAPVMLQPQALWLPDLRVGHPVDTTAIPPSLAELARADPRP